MYTDLSQAVFEWDRFKNAENLVKHGVSFTTAQQAFRDSKRILFVDARHSSIEERFFCIGRAGTGILTVRFTLRDRVIRIIGAGYWRKGRSSYEKENPIY